MEEEVEEELFKVAGVIPEVEGEEGKVEVVVVGIGGRMGKQQVVNGAEERVVVVSNTPLLQTPKLLLQSFINTRNR